MGTVEDDFERLREEGEPREGRSERRDEGEEESVDEDDCGEGIAWRVLNARGSAVLVVASEAVQGEPN